MDMFLLIGYVVGIMSIIVGVIILIMRPCCHELEIEATLLIVAGVALVLFLTFTIPNIHVLKEALESRG